MKGRVILLLLMCLLNADLARAQNVFKVVDSQTTASFERNQLATVVTVESSAKFSSARILVEVLNPNDLLIARSDISRSLNRGKNTLKIPIFMPRKADIDEILWYRLRISVGSGSASTESIISLSEILPDLFELSISSADNIVSGATYPVRIRAFHPTTGNAAEKVKVGGKLTIELETDGDDDKLELNASGETDKDGFALLEFRIPANARLSNGDDAEIEIKGEKNNLSSSLIEDLQSRANFVAIYLNTDKTLYQPNQKLYARALATDHFWTSGNKVAADRELQFTIKDEDGLVLYRENATTSRFGIASIEWQIPENAKIGSYRVIAEDESQNREYVLYFKISRYELPNFYVKPEPGKPFYLPDEMEAEVTIEALYLFGKPVAEGKVKVVQESSRKWNYRDQKWDVEEESVYEGETDGEGKYVAKIDLSAAHKKLAEDEDEKFKDLNFTAYFTDLSSNRTEQRRFDLRVSKEPIHVYVIRKSDHDQSQKLPVIFYVTTFSADGLPLVCDVEVKGKYEDEKDKDPETLLSLKTNPNGAGKAEFKMPLRADDVYYDDLELKISARDGQGRAGTHSEEISVDDDEHGIVVKTDKAVYGQNEPIKISILSTEADKTVFVDVARNFASVAYDRVKLKNGRAELLIPFKSDFKDQLTITAYFEDEDGDSVSDSKGIFYPVAQNLKIDLKTAKDIFRPNEEATLDFAVTKPGIPKNESALGVVIVDKAVEERARTDAEFGGNTDIFTGFRGLLGRNNFGGLTVENVDGIDQTKLNSPDLQLSAEIIFFRPDSYVNIYDNGYSKNLFRVFNEMVSNQMKPVKKALEEHFAATFEYPANEIAFRKILNDRGIKFGELRDPWGEEYRVSFHTERTWDKVFIWSNGANKIREEESYDSDADDFIAESVYFEYFKETGQKIDKAVANYYSATGKYIRDIETLTEVLKKDGVDLNALKDHWGEPYQVEFGVAAKNYTIVFRSGNYDQKFEGTYDDFVIWTTETDYFTKDRQRIQDVLDRYVSEKKTFPKDENEFRTILIEGGVDLDQIRDGWGRPVYLNYTVNSRFADRVEIQNVATQGESPKETFLITPVTQVIAAFNVKSLGEDGEKADYYYGDVNLATFAGIVSEQKKDDGKQQVVVPKAVLSDGKAAIYGVVSDANDFVVPNVKITFTDTNSQIVYETYSNNEGSFLRTGLQPGLYSVKAVAAGFKTSIVNQVRIQKETITNINFKLEAGAVNEVVMVISEQVSIETSDSKLGTSISTQHIATLPAGVAYSVPRTISGGVLAMRASEIQIDGASGSENLFVVTRSGVKDFKSGQLNLNNELPAKDQRSTPRLREYFPETLLWQPEIITDQNGKASFKFRLADNITTWKIYTIASDLEGTVGVAEKEIKAFQPFFVDLVPPRILTVGDEVYLPVQVRNYSESDENVEVSMAESNWFSILGTAKQEIEVKANSTGNAIFGFRAEGAVTSGKQQVEATARNDADAIEKPVTVNPNGQEITETDSRVFGNSELFEIDFPANALPNTQRAELKIYPNLFSHVSESVVGLLQRPYGCGEQLISSTYPNLMLLKFKLAKSSNERNSAIERQAKRNLLKGYEKLLGYRLPEGGFSYWGGRDEADVALTAYAIRFLNDAQGFIEIDGNVIEAAQTWLISQQQKDGSWTKKYYGETVADIRRTKLLTSYVARILAIKNVSDGDGNPDELETAKANSLGKALNYLKSSDDGIDEPYSLALYGLALFDSGRVEDAAGIAEKLARIAIPENDAVYWKLETNTPFYGWGTAGRIETTALVIQLLAKVKKSAAAVPNIDDLVSKGTLFMLRKKDRYGVWYSTQTTVNVLDSLVATLAAEKPENRGTEEIQVVANGKVMQTTQVSADQIAPISLDLAENLNLSENRLEVRNSSGSPVMVQIVASHYIAWKDSDMSQGGEGANINQSRQLRLKYLCDTQTAAIMQEVLCGVEAERIGFRGYGMLLAEIGTPPGAEIDRESLDEAMRNDWSLSRYDILPDRIVFYMWAKAGGTRINFKFKPRYAINAQTPASIVYDYYNPEAQALVAPMKFSVGK